MITVEELGFRKFRIRNDQKSLEISESDFMLDDWIFDGENEVYQAYFDSRSFLEMVQKIITFVEESR